MSAPGAYAAVLRGCYPRVLARTLGLTRNLPDAEDAVHDAMERALRHWPEGGAPDSPEAWLVTVAANAHRDRARRARREEPREDALDALAAMSPWARIAVGEPEVARGWKDELLRLLFASCHPSLDDGEGAALALATVVGLSTREIAAAFCVEPRSMEQRLTRARRRLREQGDYEGEVPRDAGERLGAVLRAVYLLFNEGYWSTSDEAPVRGDLCRLAVGLARSLHEAFAHEAEAAGLLGLLLLHDARRGARLGPEGAPVPLPEQDRARWDRRSIDEATTLLEATLARGAPGPMQIEAAVSAVHCRARSAAETDWAEIAALCGVLEALRPSPSVRVNRAFAVARVEGPRAGLALLDAAGSPARTAPYASLVRGALLAEAGETDRARVELERAHESARNAHERAQVRARLDALGPAPDTRTKGQRRR